MPSLRSPSLLMRALEHDLKCKAWPQSRGVPHWKTEAHRFRNDVKEFYRKAPSLLPEMMDGQLPLAVDPVCPTALGELLQKGR